MRVIAGKFRSRTLRSLEGQDTRPTYDRLKETIFNVLQAAGMIDDSRFLDLFAGTGSVGIEALSRGAAHVCFVESNRKAVQVIRGNLEALGVSGAEVLNIEVADALRQLAAAGERWDICFLDPPYKSQGAYEQVLRLVSTGDLLTSRGVVVAEHEKRFDPGDGPGTLKRYRRLDQGESSVSFYRAAALEPAREPAEEPEG